MQRPDIWSGKNFNYNALQDIFEEIEICVVSHRRSSEYYYILTILRDVLCIENAAEVVHCDLIPLVIMCKTAKTVDARATDLSLSFTSLMNKQEKRERETKIQK